MNKSNATLYYDATQLVHWEGKLTGIPRVMHELAIRYQKSADDQEVVFVSWVKELQQYAVVDLDASLKGGVQYTRHGQQAPASKTSSKQEAQLTKSLKRYAKGGLRRAARVSPQLAGKLETRLKVATLNDIVLVAPNPGDVIFIPWGEWWDPNFIAFLQQQARDGTHIVPLIHDVGPLVQPQFSAHSTESLAEYCREVVPIASLVIVISQHTKRDLEGWLKQQNCTVPKIKIFREGDDFSFAKPIRPLDPQFNASGLKGRDYIMFVGTVELKKNHMLLYYVYKLARERGITLPKLLIVGRLGWKAEMLYELTTNDVETKDDILFLQNISDEELSWLYDHCLFTVQTSFYEGWGIPVAESLARGVPCLAARTSSMVEIAEGIVKHFSAASTDECLAGIERWLEPKALAAATVKAKTYRQTTWDESFEQVKALIKELA